VIVAVYIVLGARLAAGVKVAVRPARPTVPETGVVPCCTMKVDVVIEDGSIATLKVTEILLSTPVGVDLFTAAVEITVGRIPLSESFLQPATNATNSTIAIN
jgi:hypothetical protein